MKVAVVSNCALDVVHLKDSIYEQVGGDALYSGLTAREFGADVSLQTRFGSDFPVSYLDGMAYEQSLSERPTTRFRIEIEGRHRRLYLLAECDDIQSVDVVSDATIVSPIYHEVRQEYSYNDGYNLLNPQGMLREAGDDGLIGIRSATPNLSGVDVLKVNPSEIHAMTGMDGDEGMVALAKQGVSTILRTNGEHISMLYRDLIYDIRLPNKEIHDTTGLGGILCGAFVCVMLKEHDVLWALCFAGGAVQAALDSKKMGLLKVPRRGAVQTNASYFYNLVEYRQV